MPVLTVRAFAPLMQQTVQIAPCTGYDNHGQRQYGADVAYKAAVVGEAKLVRTHAGEQAPSMVQVYLMANVAVSPTARITLSTEDVGSTERMSVNPLILNVRRYPFMAGQFFTEIDL